MHSILDRWYLCIGQECSEFEIILDERLLVLVYVCIWRQLSSIDIDIRYFGFFGIQWIRMKIVNRVFSAGNEWECGFSIVLCFHGLHSIGSLNELNMDLPHSYSKFNCIRFLISFQNSSTPWLEFFSEFFLDVHGEFQRAILMSGKMKCKSFFKWFWVSSIFTCQCLALFWYEMRVRCVRVFGANGECLLVFHSIFCWENEIVNTNELHVLQKHFYWVYPLFICSFFSRTFCFEIPNLSEFRTFGENGSVFFCTHFLLLFNKQAPATANN